MWCKNLPQHVMYKLRFMKLSPINIILYLISFLSNAGFWDVISLPMESPATLWEKLNARKIQEMPDLRHICHLKMIRPGNMKITFCPKPENKFRYHGVLRRLTRMKPQYRSRKSNFDARPYRERISLCHSIYNFRRR
jgi:hypothetical protein